MSTFAFAQSELTTVKELDLPKDYKEWLTAQEELKIREGLALQKESWVKKDNNDESLATQMIFVRKINSEVISVVHLTAPQPETETTKIPSQASVTMHWLVKNGFIKITDTVSSKTAGEKAEKAWMISLQYLKERFNINDSEVEQMDKFFEW
ncbi:MAG: hypothetical protein HYT63_03130 [Candidatus Yanofskybacteria bacterium]|nr:hypothetical protein [Candidatus Yanofskybacteria bacterium]